MRGPIVLVSLLCCISMHRCQVSAGIVIASVRHVTIPSLNPFVSQMHFENGTYTYALCNDTHLDKNDNPDYTFNCRVAIESAVPSSSRSCNVTLRNAAFSIARVSMLTPDKAILLWTGKKSPEYPYYAMVINVLDFKDGCRLYETWLRFPEKISTLTTTAPCVPVVPYNDGTFDIFYENRDLCEKGRLCKVRFNDKAEKIGKEEPWVDIAYFTIAKMYAVWPRSPAHGHLVVDYANEYSLVSYVDVKGHQTPLRNYTWSRTPQHGESRPEHSINHNLLTICQNTPDICEQLDLANNNTVLIPPYTTNSKLPTFAMHSLRDGGFLHLQGERLTRFDAKGQKAGTVEIDGLDCEPSENTFIANVFEKGDGRYCISSMCYVGDRLEIQRKDRFGIACCRNRFDIHGKVRFGIACCSDKNFS